MLVRRPGQGTDQECRSLIQKAVRRRRPDVVRKAASYLVGIGDEAWLRNRLGVIAAEECWIALGSLDYNANVADIIGQLVALACLEKNKEAAGLGTLGYALSEGDRSVLSGLARDNRSIKIICEAIRRPNDFWSWARREAVDELSRTFVESAFCSFRLAGWPWDKAFAISAGYLALSSMGGANSSLSVSDLEFPYWVAIDRHTAFGKDVLRSVARNNNISYEMLGWVSFYFESATCDQLKLGGWWEKEISWRMSTVGISLAEGKEIWDSVRPEVISRLSLRGEDLRRRVEVESFLDVDMQASQGKLI